MFRSPEVLRHTRAAAFLKVMMKALRKTSPCSSRSFLTVKLEGSSITLT